MFALTSYMIYRDHPQGGQDTLEVGEVTTSRLIQIMNTLPPEHYVAIEQDGGWVDVKLQVTTGEQLWDWT